MSSSALEALVGKGAVTSCSPDMRSLVNFGRCVTLLSSWETCERDSLEYLERPAEFSDIVRQQVQTLMPIWRNANARKIWENPADTSYICEGIRKHLLDNCYGAKSADKPSLKEQTRGIDRLIEITNQEFLPDVWGSIDIADGKKDLIKPIAIVSSRMMAAELFKRGKRRSRLPTLSHNKWVADHCAEEDQDAGALHDGAAEESLESFVLNKFTPDRLPLDFIEQCDNFMHASLNKMRVLGLSRDTIIAVQRDAREVHGLKWKESKESGQQKIELIRAPYFGPVRAISYFPKAARVKIVDCTHNRSDNPKLDHKIRYDITILYLYHTLADPIYQGTGIRGFVDHYKNGQLFSVYGLDNLEAVLNRECPIDKARGDEKIIEQLYRHSFNWNGYTANKPLINERSFNEVFAREKLPFIGYG